MPRRNKDKNAPRQGAKRYAYEPKAKPPVTVRQYVHRQIKNALGGIVESKVLDYSTEPIPALCYYHNTPYVHDTDMFYCQQNVRDEELIGAQNRIGDSIFVKNIQLKLMITNYQTRPNLCYRITVIKVDSGNTVLPGGSVIYGHPQCGNMIIAPIDTELAGLKSVVYDKKFHKLAFQTAQDGNEDKKFIWEYNIKVNRKVRYDNGSVNTFSPTYRLLVTCYDSQGTLITDNIARFTYFRRTHFMDA